MVALIALSIVLIFLSVDYFVQWKRASHADEAETEIAPVVDVRWHLALSPPRSPAGVYFAPGHTWAYLLPSGNIRVGLTDFARSIMGSVDEVEPRTRTTELRRGDPLLRMRRGKHTATFHSPIDGTIERVNLGFLGPDAARPNEPYTSSWIFEMRPQNTSDIPKTMFLGEAARSWLKQEVERLRVFLATTLPEPHGVGVTMQDGGLPDWGAVDSFTDTDWQRFQDRFFGKMHAPTASAQQS
jgi:glycine cleavage system H lipoate-binding protein